MSEVIRETENYILVVDQNPFDELGNIAYLIKNRETDVVEIDTRIRAEAHKLLLELETAYNAVLEYEKAHARSKEAGKSSGVISIDKKSRIIN